MSRTLSIDGDHLFFLSLTGEKVLDEQGNPIKQDGKFVYRPRTFEESCKIVDSYLTSLLNITFAEGYVGFFGGSSASRLAVYDQYKANRKGREPLPNLDLMKSYLREKWGFYHLKLDVVGNTYETDDYVVSFARQNDAIIVSPDKDELMLVGRHFNPMKMMWIETTAEEAKLAFFQDLIVGQAGDNIKGIKSLGEKAAKTILNNPLNYRINVFETYINTYGESLGIQEFYKNYVCLKLKEDLDVSQFKVIEWKNNIEFLQ